MSTNDGTGRAGAASPRALADLARAGSSLLLQPNMRVAFEVHHAVDRPGYLRDVLTGRPSGAVLPQGQSHIWESPFTETLAASAYGAGLVVGVRTLPLGPDAGEGRNLPGEAPVEPAAQGSRIFRGTEVPNVAFTFDVGSEFEGIISIETEHTELRPLHAKELLSVLHRIADVAVNIAKAPILYLHSPVQLPPEPPPQDNRMSPAAAPPAWALGLRFGIALSPPTAELRLRIANHLAEYCAEHGFGLWLADSRPGYRAGNWFEVCQHDRSTVSGLLREVHGPAGSDRVTSRVPFTLVGPARTGAIWAVSTFLSKLPEVGIVACSSITIDDLDFIHLQLTSESLDAETAIQLTQALTRETTPDNEPWPLLRRVVGALRGGDDHDLPRTGEEAVALAGYQAFAGPVQDLPAGEQANRVALWVSWELEGRTADFSVPFLELYHALRDVRLLRTRDEEPLDPLAGPNFEYLICRRVRQSIRGKGKISLPRQALHGHQDLGALTEEIESAWALRLRGAHHVRELTVSSWEYWLGHWTSPI